MHWLRLPFRECSFLSHSAWQLYQANLGIALNHRITGWLELEGTIKLVLFQPLPRAVTPSTILGCSKSHPT